MPFFAPPDPLPPALTGADSFPFALPWNGGPTGDATDVSFLNAAPAGKNGRIVSRGGHFYEAKTGKRIRFFGTNLGAAAAFPRTPAEADAVAGRLAKLGVNLVRLHHLQNDWDLDGGTIWKRDRMQIELDPVQLDKLDRFVYALKKRGIYTNLNLQTTRKYLPEMGFPASVTKLNGNFAKKVDKFDRRMIELQKEYARDLLDRKNPYTGLRYADDPAVAILEINNENSLVGWPGESAGAGLDGLPTEFRTQLLALWNGWLKRKYATDAALRAAWPDSDTTSGADLVPANTAWTFENQSNGDVRFEPSGRSLVATVTTNPGADWHVQAHLAGITLEPGEPYTVSFRVRADRPTAFRVDARLDRPDWRFLGLGAGVSAGPEWRDVTLSFRATDPEPGHARIGLTLGEARGRIEVADLRVVAGERSVGLPAGQSVEGGTVAVPLASVGSPAFADWTRFLLDTEVAYDREMRDYLTKDLGFRDALIAHTQISWGGLTGLAREAESPYLDNHAYWNHPTFLDGDWSPKAYRVDRAAQVDAMGGPKFGGALWGLAQYRVFGRPYSVSEYDHPAPSDFAVEMMPMLSTFAALQDWDAVYTFAYEATGAGRPNDRYEGYFDQARIPAKAAFYPAAALVFRLGLVPASLSATALELGADEPWLSAPDAWSAWGSAMKSLAPSPLRSRYGLLWRSERPKGAPDPRATLSVADRVYRADAPAAKALTGFVAGKRFVFADGPTFAFGEFGNRFASLMLISRDGAPIRGAKRLLLTVGARTENPGMAWNATRDSVSDQWGQGPVRAERVPVSVTLPVSGPRRVWALLPSGARGKEIPARFRAGRLEFSTRGADSMWFEIAPR